MPADGQPLTFRLVRRVLEADNRVALLVTGIARCLLRLLLGTAFPPTACVGHRRCEQRHGDHSALSRYHPPWAPHPRRRRLGHRPRLGRRRLRHHRSLGCSARPLPRSCCCRRRRHFGGEGLPIGHARVGIDVVRVRRQTVMHAAVAALQVGRAGRAGSTARHIGWDTNAAIGGHGHRRGWARALHGRRHSAATDALRANRAWGVWGGKGEKGSCLDANGGVPHVESGGRGDKGRQISRWLVQTSGAGRVMGRRRVSSRAAGADASAWDRRA